MHEYSNISDVTLCSLITKRLAASNFVPSLNHSTVGGGLALHRTCL